MTRAPGLSKLLIATAGALDRRFGWDRLPRPIGVFTLAGLRTELRQKNLYDTGAGGAKAAANGGSASGTRRGAEGIGSPTLPTRPDGPS